MDINYIECFINVARTLNFTEAAKQSYISQSMVSRYISKLEEELGSRLFIRTSREVSLTAEGRAFLPYANDIVSSMKKADFALNQLRGGYTGRIKIVCDAAAGEFTAKCVREFHEKYPGVAVELSELHGDGQGADDYDCVIALRDMLPDSGGTEYAVVHEDSLAIALSAGRAKKSYKLSELQNERFIILSEAENPILYMEIMDMFRAARISPEIVSRPDSAASALIAAGAGMGMALLPSGLLKSTAAPNIAKAQISDIDTTLVYAAAWKKSSANAAAPLFTDIVKKYARNEDYEY